jgi:hypothetical protein
MFLRKRLCIRLVWCHSIRLTESSHYHFLTKLPHIFSLFTFHATIWCSFWMAWNRLWVLGWLRCLLSPKCPIFIIWRILKLICLSRSCNKIDTSWKNLNWLENFILLLLDIISKLILLGSINLHLNIVIQCMLLWIFFFLEISNESALVWDLRMDLWFLGVRWMI